MSEPYPGRPYDGSDDDAIFADIVAHLNDDPPEPGGGDASLPEDAAAVDPTDETADVEASGETHAGAGASTGAQPEDKQPTNPGQWATDPPLRLPENSDSQPLPAPQPWRAHEVDDDLEEHFEPRPVIPLPAGDLQFWAILAGMAGGPLLLLYLVFFNREASSYWILIAIAMAVGGFALLVSRMPGQQDDDDDGARL